MIQHSKETQMTVGNSLNNSDNEITINAIVEEFSERLEKGEAPSIGDYKEQYPQLADKIEAVLPALLMLENIGSHAHGQKLAVDDSIPEIVGDYQIIQEIGRGGMGIVFEARHATMRRRVALKVLPKSSAEKAGHLSRFMTEARSAGQLHHTNIVPVFEVGKAEGLHFYSMQYIHGDNLERVIEDVKRLRQQSKNKRSSNNGKATDNNPSQQESGVTELVATTLVEGNRSCAIEDSGSLNINTDFDSVPPEHVSNTFEPNDSSSETTKANSSGLSDSVLGNSETSSISKSQNPYHHRVAAVGVQVAEALEYAHNHGVLHRDVKPANLILDTEGNIWITDFGLAKYGEDLTQTGDVVGTLRYMAPERFKGKADGRSDIYSLGLTLYELCTLRCAFEGNDRANLMNEVSHPSPTAPRKIDDTIPRDLETIVLKAIDPQPERRYQTAIELSEDLRLFLADRPIKARRTSARERFWRACRRNPLGAFMSACIATLLVILAVGSLWFAASEREAHKKSQLDLYETKLDQARMQRLSQRFGQRFDSLNAIRDATKLLPNLEFEPEHRKSEISKLRNEAISSMSLSDVRNVWTKASVNHWGLGQKISFNRSYKLYAEANIEGDIRVLTIDNDKPAIKLPGPGMQSWIMKFSPNSRYLAVTYNKENALYRDVELHIWDLENPDSPIEEILGVVNFDFSSDSQSIAYTLFGGGVESLELDSLDTRQVNKDVQARLVRFSPDGKAIAFTHRPGNQVEIWSLPENGKEPSQIWVGEANGSVSALGWRDNILAVGTASGSLCIWPRNASPDNRIVIPIHQFEIKRLHIHPFKDIVVTEALDASVRVTDLMAQKEMLKVENAESLLESGFASDGRLGHYNNETRTAGIWELTSPSIKTWVSKKTRELGAQFHPHHPNLIFRLTTASIEIWDVETSEILTRVDGQFKDLQISSNGKILFTCGIQGIERREVTIKPDRSMISVGEPVTIFHSPIELIALSHSGETIIASERLKLRVINSRTGKEDVSLGRHSKTSSISISADDRWFMTGASRGKGAAVWEIESGKKVDTLLANEVGLAIAMHPTDPSSMVLANARLSFWDTDTWKPVPGKHLQVMKTSNLEMLTTSVVYSPDGNYLAINSQMNELTIIDASNCQILARVPTVDGSRLTSFRFSPDSKKIAMSCFSDLQILDLAEIHQELSRLGLGW